jgi:hypothetical protein
MRGERSALEASQRCLKISERRFGRSILCFVMTDQADPFERLLWVQDFAAHLANLGARGPMRLLVSLGEEQYDSGERRDPRVAAQVTWDRWPTQPDGMEPHRDQDRGDMGLTPG